MKIILLLLITNYMFSQTIIQMQKMGGVYTVPCKVNGLPLRFIFDTGASDVSISLTEATFMLKNGFLYKEDLGETVYYSIANGDIAEGTKLNLRMIEIGGLKLYNVSASIVHQVKAPLLLGQSAIANLGRIQIENETLTIYKNLNKITNPINNIKNGNVSVNNKYRYVSRINQNHYKVCINDKCGVINSKKKITIPLIYDFVENTFQMGFGNVKLNNKYAAITDEGRFITDFIFDHMFDFEYKKINNSKYNIAVIKLNNKWGMIDENGYIIIKPLYDWIERGTALEGGFIGVGIDDSRTVKYGKIDIYGNIVIPPIYNTIEGYKDNGFIVSKDGRKYKINKNNECIDNCN